MNVILGGGDDRSAGRLGIHQSLRVTPAMAAGVTDQLWEIGDIVRLVENVEPKPIKRGPYKGRSADYR